MGNIVKSLLNSGINSADAQLLGDLYASQPEFVDGLEMIARSIALNEPVPLAPPTGEPWRAIYNQMSGAADTNAAFLDSLAQYDPSTQRAITSAVTTRMVQIQQYQEQFQANGNPKRRKIAEYVRILSHLGYQFKYNLCTRDIECNGKPMHDALSAEIRGRLRESGIFQIGAAEDAYTAYAWSQRYHPIREYLMSLKYEGKDAIGEAAQYFSDRDGLFPIFFRRWMIGAVARVMGYQEQNRMLVLDGKQHLGKDHFVKWLCSPMPEYFYEGAIMADDKDCRLRLMSTWIWNVSEVGGTTRRQDREALKHFLTLGIVRERKPYGKFDIQGPAMSSFIGTINNEGGFLSDPTGNRRFMVVKMQSIDWDYVKLDVDQLWAQAYDLYQSGEKWALAGDELDKANTLNEEYLIADIVMEAIYKYFQVDTNQRNWFTPTIDIMQHLELKGMKFNNARQASMDISTALTRMGLEKINGTVRGQRARGWVGIQPV